MVEIRIDSDRLHERYADMLAGLSRHDGKRAFARALNYGGDRARTQVRRSLAKQTGIAYQQIKNVISTDRAHPAKLSYSLTATGDETNLALFGARPGVRGVSAAPWGKRRTFKKSFIVSDYGGKVYKRQGAARGPLSQLWGPNVGRELVREPTSMYWNRAAVIMMYRVAHELRFLISKVK